MRMRSKTVLGGALNVDSDLGDSWANDPHYYERFSALGLATLAIYRVAIFRQDSAVSRFRIVGQWELRAKMPLDRIPTVT